MERKRFDHFYRFHNLENHESDLYVVPPRNRSIDGVWAADPSDVPGWEEKKWGTKIMVWGGISFRGVTQLRFLEIVLKSRVCLRVDQKAMLLKISPKHIIISTARPQF